MQAQMGRGAQDGATGASFCLILALVALVPQARAQPLPPDQAGSEIVKTLDRITGRRDSNREAVRRGLIACRLFPTRSSPDRSKFLGDREAQPEQPGVALDRAGRRSSQQAASSKASRIWPSCDGDRRPVADAYLRGGIRDFGRRHRAILCRSRAVCGLRSPCESRWLFLAAD